MLKKIILSTLMSVFNLMAFATSPYPLHLCKKVEYRNTIYNCTNQGTAGKNLIYYKITSDPVSYFCDNGGREKEIIRDSLKIEARKTKQYVEDKRPIVLYRDEYKETYREGTRLTEFEFTITTHSGEVADVKISDCVREPLIAVDPIPWRPR